MADIAGEDFRIETSRQRTLRPRGNLDNIGVADQPELHAGRTESLQGLPILPGHTEQSVAKSLDTNPRGLGDTLVRYGRIDGVRQFPDDLDRVSLLAGEAPSRLLY
jgi:hypothetical protein